MLKLKTLAVLALGSSAAFAGSMGPVCAPGNVTVPCENNAWAFGAQALYLKPTLNNDFAYFGTRTTAAGTTVLLDTDPNWGWGFEIEGAYHFNTGNDFNVNWYHLSKQTQVTGTHARFPAAPARYSVKPQWDAVNFEFGQHVDFGDMKNIRFHGGAQWARTKVGQVVRNSTTNANLLSAQTTYNGFGPRLGADMSYDFGNGVGVFGNAATAILVGSSKFNNYVRTVRSTTGSYTTIVPTVDAKLGANYTFAMAQGDLTLDVGYMWVNYFNAVQNNFGGAIGGAASDFGMNGLFFGGKWVGNIA